MRIIIPNFGAPDSFVDNAAFTLKAMGHEVIAPSKPFTSQRNRHLGRLHKAYQTAFPARWTEVETWLVDTVGAKSSADLVLCLTKSLRAEVLDRVKKAGVKQIACWWGDAPANIPANGLMADGWDALFLKDAAAVTKMAGVGLPAMHLNEAHNPHWHRRNFTEINSSVAVAGNYYGFRQKQIIRLLERNVPMALYGFRPPRWADPQIRANHTGQFITREEKSRIFGSALAVLNSTSLTEGDSINCRAFEIAGACGLQLIEDKPSTAVCFEPGREVLTYRSIDDIMTHLERVTDDPAYAMAVREAGHKRALAEHTYEHRLTRILDILKQC